MARIARKVLDISIIASKSMRPKLSVFWTYAKTELAPVGTKSFLHGAGGRNLEKAAETVYHNVLGTLEKTQQGLIETEKKQIATAKAAAEKALKRKEEQEKVLTVKAASEKLKQEQTKEKEATERKISKKDSPTAKKVEPVKKESTKSQVSEPAKKPVPSKTAETIKNPVSTKKSEPAKKATKQEEPKNSKPKK